MRRVHSERKKAGTLLCLLGGASLPFLLISLCLQLFLLLQRSSSFFVHRIVMIAFHVDKHRVSVLPSISCVSNVLSLSLKILFLLKLVCTLLLMRHSLFVQFTISTRNSDTAQFVLHDLLFPLWPTYTPHSWYLCNPAPSQSLSSLVQVPFLYISVLCIFSYLYCACM